MAKSQEGGHKLRTLKLSAAAIFSVVVVEVVIGLVVNSLAVLSDGLHALLDALSTVILFAATRAALKPPDEEHMYGHEKFEAIGGLIGGMVLVGVAILIFYEAGVRLLANVQVNEGLELVGFFAIGYTFCIDIFRVTIFKGASHSQSQSVKAGFYDAIADLGSTIIALLGFGLATLGFYYGDSVASIFLGSMLVFLSTRLARVSIMELSDTASKEIVQKIRKRIIGHEGVLQSENLRVRKLGSKLFIETTVKVSSLMSLDDAHTLASKIEADLEAAFGNVDTTIHIEPSEKAPEREQLVKLATVEGVREVHDVVTVYASGKLYITLHAYVDPRLSVEEAHEIADKIESRMHAEIEQLENVTVHLEPYGAEVRAVEVDEDEVRQIVQKVTKDVEDSLYVERIVTYTAESKRYINLDCCFTKQVLIAEAHEIASRIEEELRKHFEDSVVTVHIEPRCA
ncbi:cation-efflux pump [Candidatus Bathyarchaeota archaeon A05DMB-2]|jgi:cation diffusion facilitator family transporter|nr:cation-efflux pump [Candidatus Bathyarchaeota archaeon A05DMB-2]